MDGLFLLLELGGGSGKVFLKIRIFLIGIELEKLYLSLVQIVLSLHHLLLGISEFFLNSFELLGDLADFLFSGIGPIESVVLKMDKNDKRGLGIDEYYIIK